MKTLTIKEFVDDSAGIIKRVEKGEKIAVTDGEVSAVLVASDEYLYSMNNMSGIFNFTITAEFPEEDTGYIEDGFEYCFSQGNNLGSYPCENPISVSDAIPNANSFITGIIGEGVSAAYLEGIGWVGSLAELQPGEGYWFQTSTNECFQYDCSE